MKYVVRKLSDSLLETVQEAPVLLLTGPRQSGKSTLLKKLFPDYKYISLDDLRLRAQAKDDPELFLAYHKKPIIIDEIQNAPNLFSYIKMAVDNNRDYGSFILTGSEQFDLMSGVFESLAGRLAIASLTPFSIEELYTEGDTPLWHEIVAQGLFPEPHLRKKRNSYKWYMNYLESLINRDIKQNLREDKLGSFDQFIKLVVIRTAQEIIFANIAKEIGVSALTIKNWTGLLERSQIAFLLQPYFSNLGKRIIKTPKIYFIDSAITAYLTGHRDARAIREGVMAGHLFENLVIVEIYKYFHNRGEKAPIYFFRDNHGLEADLVLEINGKTIFVEIKITADPEKHHYSNLVKLIKLKPGSKGLFLCNRKDSMALTKDIEAIHWTKIFEYLDQQGSY
ncbi:MAG: ATP-binding protein [Candidatus Caenarcaniphilales bacterium]|nr:ATP-binding protein [Candidatus Caenarcaniphilales bacterium]